RVGNSAIMMPLHAIDGGTDFLARAETLSRQRRRQSDVPNAEAGLIGVVSHDERRMASAKEARPAGARHRWQGEVGGHPRRRFQLVRGDGTETGVKADKGTAADGDTRWCAGHHVAIAGPVIALVVLDGADDG